MRPSSSSSESPYGGLLGSLPGDADVDALISDRSLVRAMLQVERELARALAKIGLIPDASAAVIAAVADNTDYDPKQLGTEAISSGNPVVPLSGWLTRDVKAVSADAAAHVHFGATSQDVLDTALMLTCLRATTVVLERLDEAAATAARLAETHISTLMPGRSLSQLAAPTTFGTKAVGWLGGLDAACARLRSSRERLAVQLGGPVGTRAAWGGSAAQVSSAVAEALGLADSVPWHTERSRVVDLAAALGQAVAACGTIATDVIMLSQNEIGELAEPLGPGRGGSSAMPQKQNPIGSVLVRAAAIRTPHLVATLMTAAVQDGERATGAWHAEWTPLLDLVHLAGGATARTAEVLGGLTVKVNVMRDNTTGAGSVMFAESVSRALGAHLDRSAAQSLVAEATRRAAAVGGSLRDELDNDGRVSGRLSPAELDAAFDPTVHLEAAAGVVGQALAERECGEAP
ncbi:MAG: 3-carboxy-cis,cis-muconate cycloisomerase [Actinomycetota bacterium]|jgi:3-carboxy-cis,cis-muconate cycloisomerase|nr:3-carboxy-cis,cis-muconate cycloisomerase [Actinomycetota bacterium]